MAPAAEGVNVEEAALGHNASPLDPVDYRKDDRRGR